MTRRSPHAGPNVQEADRPQVGHQVFTRECRAMATSVRLEIVGGDPSAAGQALSRAAAVFTRVEESCTRFDPSSPLMQANRAGEDWQTVPEECLSAVAAAADAHRRTGGLFDPRVLTALTSGGYDRSLPFAPDGGNRDDRPRVDPAHLPRPAAVVAVDPGIPWAPGVDEDAGAVRIGPVPIDLGGIGKGLAVRWAAEELATTGTGHLVDAGGDCYLGGTNAEGRPWRVGVQDPRDPTGPPLAVLELSDLACATSSVGRRAWLRGDQPMHHLIDPRTGTSARSGLTSVTVVGDDTADAEVWAKALLLAGPAEAARLADRGRLAALWIDDGNVVRVSDRMHAHILWRADQ